MSVLRCIESGCFNQAFTKQSFCVLGTLCKIVSHDERGRSQMHKSYNKETYFEKKTLLLKHAPMPSTSLQTNLAFFYPFYSYHSIFLMRGLQSFIQSPRSSSYLYFFINNKRGNDLYKLFNSCVFYPLSDFCLFVLHYKKAHNNELKQ